MSAQSQVLFLGGTGYLGSAVLSRFLALETKHQFTVLTRSEEKAKLIDQIRPGQVKAVQGTHQDLDLIEKLASENDITFNCADSDDLDLTKAVLKGMAKRKNATGHRPILIHTSGTGTLIDDARGAYPSETIYSDLRANPTGKPPVLFLDSLPPTAFHRNVDLEIIEADKQALIRAFIILPSTIYGINKTELAEKGVGNPQSQQVPNLIKASIDRGRAGMVGNGQNIWPNVHINDTSELFVKVYEYSVSGKKGNHGTSGYYFAESGEYTQFALAQTIGRVLVNMKIAQDTEPTTFSQEEVDKYYNGSYYAGTNSRCRADHSRSIGWRPKKTAGDFFASVEEEVQQTIARSKKD